MTSRVTALLVDDDARLGALVAEYLGRHGVEVTVVGDGARGLAALRQRRHDVVLLDVMLPGLDGLEVCRRIRAAPGLADVPVIMLTAKGDDVDRIVGLELGADDYIVKPYELRELLARVRSVLRRVPRPSDAPAAPAGKAEEAERRIVTFGDFRADLDGRMVTGRGGAIVDLAKSEFDVLEVFLTRSNRLLSRATISDAIGFSEDPESSRAVDIRIMRLRKKIEDDPANPKFLRTVRGEGYIFSLPEEPSH